MTLTVEVAQEIEDRLLTQATATGLSVEEFVAQVLTQQAQAPVNDIVDEVFDTVSLPSGVGEGAMRRKNLYL